MSASGAAPAMTTNVGELQALQLKMAKKVAQLTKVIYLLNTKNDEHEYEMQCLEATYEADVADVLRDAQAKLHTLKTRLENKAEEELAAAAGGNEKALKQMEEMRKQQEAEKKHALAKLEKLKEQAGQNELAVRNQAKDRIDAMRKEVDDAKTQFLMRMHSFARVTKNMEAAHASTLLEQRHKSLKEMEDYVQASNQKYNAMLNERMNIEEDLRAKLKNQKESAASSKEMEARLAQAKAEADKALATQAKRYEAAASKLTQEAEAATERVIREKQERKEESEKADKAVREWKRQLDDLHQRAASDLAEAKAAQTREAEAARKLLAEAERRATDLQKQMDQLLTQAKQGADASTAAWMEERSTLQAKVAQLQGELRDALAKVDATAKEKVGLQAQLTRVEKDLAGSATTIGDLQRAVKEAQTTVRDAQTTEKDLRARLADLAASSQGGLAHAQEALREERKEHKSTRSSLARVEEECEKTRHELATLQVEDAALLARFRELQFASNDLREELRVLQAKYSVLEVASEETEAQLRATVRDLETRLQELQATMRNLAGEQGAALEALQAQYATLQADHGTCLEDLQGARGLARELADQLESLRDQHARAVDEVRSLRDQLEAEQQRAQARLGEGEHALVQLRSAHGALQAECDGLKRANARLDDSLVKLGKQVDQAEAHGKARELELLRQIDALRAQFADERAQMMGSSDQELARLKADLKDQERKAREAMADLMAAHDAAVAKLKADHALELQRVRTEVEARSRSDQQAERERAADERQRLLLELTEKETQLQQALRAHADKLQQVQTEHALQADRLALAHKVELESTTARLKKQWQEEVADVRDDLERQAREARQLAQAKEAALQKDLAALQAQSTAEAARAAVLQQELADARDEYATLRDRAEKREQALVGAHANAIDDLTQQQRDELARLMRAHADDLARLHATHAQAHAAWSEVESGLRQSLSALQYRFDHREPRSEDVARIRELEEYGLQAEKAKRKAVEEMKYYKLELLNREENYNKTFGRSPMVGAAGSAMTLAGSGPAGQTMRANPGAALAGSSAAAAAAAAGSTNSGGSSVRAHSGNTSTTNNGLSAGARSRPSANPSLSSSPSNKGLLEREEEKSANSRTRGPR